MWLSLSAIKWTSKKTYRKKDLCFAQLAVMHCGDVNNVITSSSEVGCILISDSEQQPKTQTQITSSLGHETYPTIDIQSRHLPIDEKVVLICRPSPLPQNFSLPNSIFQGPHRVLILHNLIGFFQVENSCCHSQFLLSLATGQKNDIFWY